MRRENRREDIGLEVNGRWKNIEAGASMFGRLGFGGERGEDIGQKPDAT